MGFIGFRPGLYRGDNCILTNSFGEVYRRIYGRNFSFTPTFPLEVVSECDQEIPLPQTADKPMAPRGRATQQSRDTRKTNQAMQQALSLSLPHQDDCEN